MKCTKCQFENPDHSNFCFECGQKLEQKCPQCGKAIPVDVKFCNECGQKLTAKSAPSQKEFSFDEKLEKIQRYLPKGLTEKILSQKDRIEGERKQVTVMFCDMVGFTKLSEKLGPEEAYTIMDEVYEILIHKVHDFEGTVNEMTGDGIMALFGAPIALEDAAQRAIRSSLSIHREMSLFSDRMKKVIENIPPFKLRIGIHSGPVVVGTLGSDLRVEFKAVGNTVNMASRMEGLAEPGSIYITGDTLRLTEGFFRFEALGKKSVKGKKERVSVYRVIAPSNSRTRFDVSAERGLTPFVGRKRDLEFLLDGFENAKAGRGQAFSIVSEAGAGKSRLLYEFRKAVSNENVTFLEGKCLSYSKNATYFPIIDILKSNFDVQENDQYSEIRKKIRMGLTILKVDEKSTLPYLLELLSVSDSGFDKFSMTSEEKKIRIIEALKRIVIKGAVNRPLIIAIEDLHWIDMSSEELIKYLLDIIPGVSVFLLLTYRLGFKPSWEIKSYHQHITLNRLSNRASLKFVSYLLGKKKFNKNLENLILSKTEGVPLFIEEFIKSIKALQNIEIEDNRQQHIKDIMDIKTPSTINEVVMARVDILPEGAKEVLQVSSVVEREFDYKIIKKVIGFSEKELLSHLSILIKSEIIYERGIFPNSAYIFTHALIREVVYDSLISKKRKNLHEKIGNAIEELKKANLKDYYGLLAEHFFKSHNYKKASEYSKLAARKSAKAASFRDAIEYTKKGVLSLERLPQTEDIQKKLIDFRTAIAAYAVSLGSVLEAKEAVSPIFDLAINVGYEKKLPNIYIAFGLYYLWIEEDYHKGLHYLNDVLRISEKLEDFVSLWQANYNLGWHLSWNCEFKKAFECFNTCIGLSELANNPIGTSTAKSTLAAHSLVFHGKIDLAYQISRESLEIAKKTDSILSKGYSYSSYGTACYFKGFFEEANTYLSDGRSLCGRANQLAWETVSLMFLGLLHTDMGKYQIAQDYYEKAILILESNKLTPSWKSNLKSSLIRSKVLSNDVEIGLLELFANFENIKLKVCKGWTASIIGEVLLNTNIDSSEAEIWIKKAIEAHKSNDMYWFLAKDYTIYAELFKRKRDLQKTRENLSKAIEIFRECGADGWVENYEKELVELY